LFYSSVILNGTETRSPLPTHKPWFYSSVILNGTETEIWQRALVKLLTLAWAAFNPACKADTFALIVRVSVLLFISSALYLFSGQKNNKKIRLKVRIYYPYYITSWYNPSIRKGK